MATKKSAGTKRQAAKTPRTAPKSMPKEGRDPQGGLTAKGREYFNQKEGSHLRPGVQGPADTPEKMVRKGSFLRRHFAHPRGPMKDDKGQPTRLALSAHAWGEPVPNTAGDAKKLAAKGHELLEQYHHLQDEAKATGKRAPRKSAASAKKSAGKKVAAKKTADRKSETKTATKRVAAKSVSPRKAAAKRSATKKQAARGRA